MARLQFSVSEETKVLLEQLSAAHGITMTDMVTRLITDAQHGPTASATPALPPQDKMLFDICARRLDQLQEELDTERQRREQEVEALEKQAEGLGDELARLGQRGGEAHDQIHELAERLKFLIEKAEPLLGISLRPGILYHPAPAPKRPWWRHW